MGAYAAVAYGLALTDEFGEDRLKHISPRLYSYGRALETWDKTKGGHRHSVNSELVAQMDALGIESLPEATRDGLCWILAGNQAALVIGFGVQAQDLDQAEVVSGYRARWDALVQGFPQEIQADIQQAAAIARPRVHLLTERD